MTKTELLEQVKKELEASLNYDFKSEFWDDEMKVMLREIVSSSYKVFGLEGIDNPAEWVKNMKLVDVCLILQTKEQLLSDILSERDKLQAENESLKEKLSRIGGLSPSEKGFCRICGGDSCDSDSHK